ncbi:hypothetical protein [Chitinophaga nivalis]|uniref:Outer membrane protein beta-barrel domain-containing protein n=1 Tax=Chitinophaga nivalis TaxID=2991709 RepID=A0ABT3ITG3_9BACT|nr:hypothetical protein [Chitinophaga nivalis]MCW3463050.1 hypothetical protein [Chitinophaga nivalis]MCW3487260.1 hypothetical protein [Chitinophaga nivalis]
MRTCFLLVVICMASLSSFAQTFKHGAGVQLFVDNSAYMDTRAMGGLTYSPRLHFLERNNTSLSVGVPLSIGLGGNYNYHVYNYDVVENNNLQLIINIPLMLNFNFGCGATTHYGSRFGFFVGAGYAYNFSNQGQRWKNNYAYGYRSDNTVSTSGPAGNAGVRIGVGRMARKNIEIKTAYMRGLSSDKTNVFTLATLFNF